MIQQEKRIASWRQRSYVPAGIGSCLLGGELLAFTSHQELQDQSSQDQELPEIDDVVGSISMEDTKEDQVDREKSGREEKTQTTVAKLDRDPAPSKEGFQIDPAYIWILVPSILVVMLFAWFASRGQKSGGLFASSDSTKGRFKKSDRFRKDGSDYYDESDSDDYTNSDSETLAHGDRRSDFDQPVEDAPFDLKKDKFKTTADFSVTSSVENQFDLGELSFPDDEDELMFGAGKEAAFDREQSNKPENEAGPSPLPSHAPNGPAEVAKPVDEPNRGWRKKKFTKRHRNGAALHGQSNPENEHGQQARISAMESTQPASESRDAIARTDQASKTVAANFTVSDPESLEIRDEFTSAESTHEHVSHSALDDDRDQGFIEQDHSDFGAANFDTAVDPAAMPINFESRPGTLDSGGELTVENDDDIPDRRKKEHLTAREYFQTIPEPGSKGALFDDSLGNKVEELTGKLSDLTSENEIYHQKLNLLEVKLANSEEQSQRLLQAEEDRREVQSQLQKLQSKLDAIQKENTKLDAAYEETKDLQKSLNESKSRCDQVSQERDEYRNKAMQLAELFESTQIEKKSLESKCLNLQDAQEKLDDALQREKKIQESLTRATEEKELLQLEFDELKQNSEKARTEANHKESELASQIQVLEELKKELATAEQKKAESENEVADLKSQLNELADAKSELEKSRQQFADATNEISELKSQIQEQTEDSIERQQLAASNEELIDEINQLRKREDALVEQVSELETKATELESAQEKISELDSQAKSTDVEKADLKDQIADLKTDIKELESNQSASGELELRLKTIESEKKSLEEQIEMLHRANEDADSLNSQIKALQSDIELRDDEINLLSEKASNNDDLKKELETHRATSEAKNKEILALNEKVSKLESTLDSMEAVEEAEVDTSSSQEIISEKTKRKFTRLYKAYERERRKRKEFEASLLQAEEQRDELAESIRKLEKDDNSGSDSNQSDSRFR